MAHLDALDFQKALDQGTLHWHLDVDDPSNAVFRPFLELINLQSRTASEMITREAELTPGSFELLFLMLCASHLRSFLEARIAALAAADATKRSGAATTRRDDGSAKA